MTKKQMTENSIELKLRQILKTKLDQEAFLKVYSWDDFAYKIHDLWHGFREWEEDHLNIDPPSYKFDICFSPADLKQFLLNLQALKPDTPGCDDCPVGWCFDMICLFRLIKRMLKLLESKRKVCS